MTWTTEGNPAQGVAIARRAITRRRLLWLSGMTGAAILGGPAARAAMAQPGSGPAMDGGDRRVTDLGWKEFLEQCLPVAEGLHRDPSRGGQDAYLYWLGSMIVRLRAADMPRARLGRFGPFEPPVSFGVSFRGQPFFIVEWRLEPGATLPPHCHPNASVCTLGIEGEARIRNFEIAGHAPEYSSRRTFLVRETHDEVMAPGRLNTLSAFRDNIHTFHAGERGARGIDISTYHGPDVGFSFLDIDTRSRDPRRRLHEAAWKKI
jgi:hypothetical protein